MRWSATWRIEYLDGGSWRRIVEARVVRMERAPDLRLS
jgi:hypothetical protein